MITILLVDDHTVLREGLRRLLEDYSEMKVVGEAPEGHECVRLAQQLKPDVIVMDLAMPGCDGLVATKRIVEAKLSTRILILTMHVTEDYAVRLLQAGAHGFLGKGATIQEILQAIRKVATGGCYLPPALAAAVAKRYTRRDTAEIPPLETLSDRELQVLTRLAQGATSRIIAQELHMSAKTVESYRARLLTKIGLNTTADLVRFALQHRVLEDTW